MLACHLQVNAMQYVTYAMVLACHSQANAIHYATYARIARNLKGRDYSTMSRYRRGK